MDRLSQTRRPSHPGEVLQGLYLEPLGLSVDEFAKKISVPPERIASIVNGEVSLDIDLALRFAQAFKTTPELWLNLQRNLDLWKARQGDQAWKLIEPIQGLKKSLHTA